MGGQTIEIIVSSTSATLVLMSCKETHSSLQYNRSDGFLHFMEFQDHNQELLLTQFYELLLEFHDVFQTPTHLPPRRVFDHQITLTLVAHPVNLRPYRYPPTHKKEIEKQVKEMCRINSSEEPLPFYFISAPDQEKGCHLETVWTIENLINSV
jgi:hypothetical protein